ncbi:MAG: serine/threonine-protein kinase, partial [Acidobacteriota bacterium]
MPSHEHKGPLRALEIVEGVIDLPPDERAGALLGACGADAELLEEALSLLWTSLEVSDIDTPAFAPVRASGEPEAPGPKPADNRPGRTPPEPQDVGEVSGADEAGAADGAVGGTTMGPFQILRELGQGGMGTVYLAEQREPIRRRVAVKVAREWLEEGARLRLAAERQAMARLSHENVACLYEAGATDGGHPYFAMEYVDGETLTTYCDRQRLSVAERLRLFLEVCAGVEHAHRHGIIHRDLKPSNVLVAEGDGGPRPKVIDFGIAKATDGRLHEKSLLTGQSIVGTPAYLSPESIADPDAVDTRSDVYSLGVLLQELLIGVRVIPEKAGESAIVLLRRVLEEEPPPLLRRWRRLDAETRRRTQDSRGLAGDQLDQKIRGDLE